MIEELRRIQNQKFCDPWAERDYQIANLMKQALPKFLALYDAAKGLIDAEFCDGSFNDHLEQAVNELNKKPDPPS